MLEKDFIESIQKSVFEKRQLLEVNSSELANEIFGIVNSMDDEVVENYIRHYCNEYINSTKGSTTSSFRGKVKYLSTNIYPLFAPNSRYVKEPHKLFNGHENTKRFFDKINDVASKIRYEMVKDFIEENKPLKDLPSELFQLSHVLDGIEDYIKTNRDRFEAYLYYLITDGLDKRMHMNKKLIAYNEVHTLVSKAIIGTPNLSDRVEGETILNIADEQYEKYCKVLVSDYINKNIALKNINRCLINHTGVMKTFFKMNDDIQQKFIRQRMEYHIKQRQFMSLEKFKEDCSQYDLTTSDFAEETVKVSRYIESIYDIYAKKLLEGNKDEIMLSSNNWTLFFNEGPRINNRTFKFDDIKSEKFRYEIKLYLMDECQYRIKNNNTLSLIKDSVNFLYSRNKECDSFAKIKIADIRALDNYLQKDAVVKRAYDTTKNRSVNTISKTMARLRSVTDFLIKYGKKNTLVTPTPTVNIFDDVSYRNRHNMSERTSIIPDIVSEQLENFVGELNPNHQLMYRIFENTGLRASSVCKLEENCLKPSRYPNVMILKYKPYKLENYNKKNGNLPYEEIIISLDLAKQIQAQIDKTEDLRKKYNSKYIFLDNYEKRGVFRPSIAGRKGFVDAVNKIIQNNNIVDYDGVIWNFTSRQFRKTLVSIMMDNNATDAEIAYVLGHHSQQTINRYYKEINEERIEKLNHEFFKKRFGIDIGVENLSQYSDAEKKCLYIDFVTNYRRVPLGYCSKPIADGPCDKKSGASSCEKCSRICTGKQFISEWVKLRDDRQRELNDLIEHYSKHNILIEEYSEYKEYQHILYELTLYQDTIDKINERCSEGV